MILLYLYLLCIHIIVCIFYFFFLSTKNFRAALCKGLIALFMPVAGFVSIIAIGLFEKITDKQEIDYSDLLSRQKKLYKYYNLENVDKEINVVPLEEALIINDSKTKREKIIDIFKDDVVSYTDLLRFALSDQDPETAHYAASAIMKIKDDLNRELNRIQTMYNSNPEDIDNLHAYISTLKKYIKYRIVEPGQFEIYNNDYINLLKRYVDNYKSAKDYDVFLNDLITELIGKGDIIEAEKYANMLIDMDPQNENGYLYMARICYMSRRTKDLRDYLLLMRERIRYLSENAHALIKFWWGDLQYEESR